MIEFVLNKESASFPDRLEEVSPFTMDSIRKLRDSEKIKWSSLADLVLEMGIFTQKQRYALTHTTGLGELIKSEVFFLLNTLLLTDTPAIEVDTVWGSKLRGFEETPFGDALEFFYRSQTDAIENKMFLIAQQLESDRPMKHRYAAVCKLPFQIVDGAFIWLVKDFNYVSDLGSRGELREDDDYTLANKPGKRLAAIYEILGWDLIVEQLPNFTLCRGMNEEQIKRVPYGAILDELVKIKRLNLANWIQHKDHEAKLKADQDSKERIRK